MTKWNQLGCALGGSDSRDSRDFKRIALGRLQAANAGNRRALHANESVGNSCSRCGRLGGDVHHLHAAPAIVVRKFFHRNFFFETLKKAASRQDSDYFAGFELLLRFMDQQKTITANYCSNVT